MINMRCKMANSNDLEKILGKEANYLLKYECSKIKKESLILPGPNFVDKVYINSDRKVSVLNNLNRMFNHGRLKGTGYLSILPVDQGIEHSAGASFAPNPDYFDPENIIKLAIEAGCNAVASTMGVLGITARKYAHKIPFIAKINHNELLTYPNHYDQILFGSVRQAFDMGASAIGATIYFGSEQSNRQIQEVAEAFFHAHELGMATILWCYLRNNAFKIDKVDYHESADLTGQANHIGATIGADIVKQKLPVNNGGYLALNKQSSYGKFSDAMYTDLMTDHPIDLCRYQVINGFNGRAGLINSGGASFGTTQDSKEKDLQEAVRTAVINKRAGGMGLISGRKTFQRPLKEGVEIFNAIQDVYLNNLVTIA